MSEEQTAQTEDTPVQPAGDWRDSLPEEFKDAPYFKGDKTPAEIRADLENAAAWQGNSIRIPGPDATEEARQEMLAKVTEKFPDLMKTPDPVLDPDGAEAALRKLGKPEAASDYKVPEGMEVDGTLMQQAFEAGLTQAQFQALVAQQNENVLVSKAEREAKIKEQEELLKADWGAAIEDRKAVVADYLAGDDVPQMLRDAYNNNALDAKTVQWLYAQAESSEESRAAREQNDGRTGAMSPDEAAAQRQEVWQKLASMRPTDPGYQQLMQRKRELTKLALGG